MMHRVMGDRMLPTQQGPWCTARAENYLCAGQLTDAERPRKTAGEGCEQTVLLPWGLAGASQHGCALGVTSRPSLGGPRLLRPSGLAWRSTSRRDLTANLLCPLQVCFVLAYTTALQAHFGREKKEENIEEVVLIPPAEDVLGYLFMVMQ